MSEQSRPREMALPETALITLRRSLRGEVGPLATVHALHQAGYETGKALAAPFVSGLDRDLDELPREEFWTRLGTFLSSRGWGHVEHRDPHPAVGLLVSRDWAEAGDAAAERQPSCAFSAGLLASLLGRVADGPIAVLETRCRARGDGDCTFAFGSEATVHALYGSLLEGSDLDGALAAL